MIFQDDFRPSMRSFLFTSLFIVFSLAGRATDSWVDIINNGSGELTFYWYPNNVNISDSKDVIDGVEHDLAFAFANYLKAKYDIELKVNWIETSSFGEILELIENGRGGTFGTSSISITPERQKKFQFTPPYLADIAVLVSASDVAIAHTPSEFEEVFRDLNVVTIRNTTLSNAIEQLQEKLGVTFPTTYVEDSGTVIEKIESSESSFGYVDLPNFLISIQNNSKIRRQFFYPIKLEGLAMIFPKDSDWSIPVDDYFQSAQFEEDTKRIILKYFGGEIGDVIDRIAKSAEIGPLEEIVISNRERELRYEELLRSAEREREKNQVNTVLAVLLGFVVLCVLYLVLSSRVKSQVNRVLLEKQIFTEETNEQLRRLNEEKNDLIKVLAHDLRSPLSSIQGCAMLMNENGELDEDSKRMVAYINQSSAKIKEMIAKILDVDAIESGDRNVLLEVISPLTIIKDVIRDLSSIAQKKKIEISITQESEEKVLADRFYLAQVVENLLSNAIKFSEKGSIIFLVLSKEEENIRITVQDQGPGLSNEDKSKVFKKFQKLSTKPTDGEETVGLGLSIVKKYTEMMGGKISFTSDMGSGTAFFVDLPLANQSSSIASKTSMIAP